MFVQRGLRVERLYKAVGGGRGLSCLTLVIPGLFPTSEEAVGYFFNYFFFYFLDPLCDVCPRNTLLCFASPCARALCMSGLSPAAVWKAGVVFVGAVPHGPPLLPPLPRTSSFNESPVNNTLQGGQLNNAVTQEPGGPGAELCSPAPPPQLRLPSCCPLCQSPYPL